MNPATKPTLLPFPVRGVDQGSSYAEQPEGTCPDLRNVRALDSRDRKGGGKRAGFVRAFTTKAGDTPGALSNRVTGLSLLSKARTAPAGPGGTVIAVTQTFVGLTVGTQVDSTSCSSNGADYAYFKHSNFSAGNVVNYAGVNGVNSAISGKCIAIDSEAFAANGKVVPHGFCIDYFTTNDITATIETIRSIARSTASPNSYWGGVNEPLGVGPFIRGSNVLNQMIMARLRPGTLANTFLFEIVEVGTADPQTQLAVSAQQTVGGGGAASQYTIRIFETSTGVSATLVWADESINVTIAATTVSMSGQSRGGVIVCTDSAGASGGTGGAITSWRKVKQLVYGKRVPSSYVVYKTADATSSAYGAANFFVADFFRAIMRSSTVTTVKDGLFSQPTQTTHICIDGANNVITTNNSSASADNTLNIFADLDPTTSGPTGIRAGVDVQPIPNFTNGAPGKVMQAGAAFRVSDDSTTFLAVSGAFFADATTVNTGCPSLQLSGLTQRVYNSGGFVAATSVGNNHEIIMRETDRLRFTDDGTTIRIYMNGILVHSYTPASFPGTGLRCGGAMFNNNSGTLEPAQCQAIRIVQGEGSNAVDITETNPLVLVVTANKVEIGDLTNNTLTTCTGSALMTGAVPAATSFNLKFYCLDGTSVGGLIVDPILFTTSDWVASAGTAPWDDPTIGNMRLITSYRGRIAVARADQNPSFWALSRTFAPLDWDYGASPTRTAAVAGTNAIVGQPADAITALIAYGDDYLVFGGASSLWILEGDPGYGGKIQNMTYKNGVFGPRAWVFDESGTLYFIGSGGLYKLQQGSRQPENISGNRLTAYLDRVDAGSTFCQLAYDGLNGYLHVFLTPVAGSTVGTHVVYDTRDGAFWLDMYPLVMGPWATCELVGSADEDRRFLIAGDDGYIRRPRDTSTDDDGNSISAYVRYKPLEADGGLYEQVLSELQFQCGSASGAFNWEVLTAKTASDVSQLAVGTGSISGTIGGGTTGFNTPVRVRTRGGCHQLVVSQNSSTLTWQLERALAFMAPGGRRR